MRGLFLWSDKTETQGRKTTQETKTLEHQMNWNVEFSYRPYVYKKGEYSSLYSYYENVEGQWNKGQQSIPLTYYMTDRTDIFDNSYHYDKDILYEHRKVLFSMDHQVVLNTKHSQQLKTLRQSNTLDLKARAKKELSLGLSDQYKNKEILSHQSSSVLSLSTASSYDFIKARDRKHVLLSNTVLRDRANVPQPWAPLMTSITSSWGDFRFNFSNTYNFYNKISTANNLAVTWTLPLESALSYTQSLSKDFKFNLDGSYVISKLYETHYILSTGLLPHLLISYNLGLKKHESDPKNKYSHMLSLTYLPPSDCWGLKFLWEKKFTDSSNRGTYYLSLIVKSFGQTNEFGNLMARVNT